MKGRSPEVRGGAETHFNILRNGSEHMPDWPALNVLLNSVRPAATGCRMCVEESSRGKTKGFLCLLPAAQ